MRKPSGLTISLSVVLALFFVAASAHALPPEGSIGAYVEYDKGPGYGAAYFRAKVDDQCPAGGPFYPAWCVDKDIVIVRNSCFVANMESTATALLPTPLEDPECRTKIVNYVLNKYERGDYVFDAGLDPWEEIQKVIWLILEGALPVGPPWDGAFAAASNAESIHAEAMENGCVPIPECGVIAYLVTATLPSGEPIQPFIIVVPLDCDPCEGKVTELTLEYVGDEDSVEVKVVQKQDGGEIFDDTVVKGVPFSFSGEWKGKGTMGPEIGIFVDGSEDPVTCIHTSCSRLIGIGTKCGDFVVVAGESKEGGPLPIVPLDDDTACVTCNTNGNGKGRSKKGYAPGKYRNISTLWGDLKTE
ncbi:hypothetical protein ACFL6S_25025 [Candidatus Poribacteria bacterium]